MLNLLSTMRMTSANTDYILPPLTEVPSSPAAKDTCQDTFPYPHFQHNLLDFNCEQSPSSREKSPTQNTSVKYECATVISQPHQQHSRTQEFSSLSSTSLSSPTPDTLSRSVYFTNCSSSQNHLYQHHKDHTAEVHHQHYSTQLPNYFGIPENCGHFLDKIHDSDSSTNGSGNIPTNNLRFSFDQDSQILCSLNFETDINNNNSNIGAISRCRDHTIFDNSTNIVSDKTNPTNIDRKATRLPPFAVLLSNSPGKQGSLESNQSIMRTEESMFDESDDSDINLRNSLSSAGEETHYTDLTNVSQHEHGQHYMDHTHEIIFGEWPLDDPDFSLKNEPVDDYESWRLSCDFPDNNYDEPNEAPLTPDSDGYDSSSTDRVLTSQYYTAENTTVAATYPYRSDAEVPLSYPYSGHESSSSDEGYSEGQCLEYILPDFKELQNQTDPDKVPQRKRSSTLNCKEKKKAVRESLPYVEKERRKPGRKPGQVSNVLHLWEFMRDLLHSSENQGIIEWISKSEGVFRVMNSTEVARLWGAKKKNKKLMTYEKLSRSLRYSRLEGYFADLPRDKNYPKKLCFKFGPKSKDWH